MEAEPAVEARGLEKSYGAVRVLAGVELRVAGGSVFALLGPNGAGKTTTVRILSTLIRGDAGSARVAGFDVVTERREVRMRISLTGQFAALDALQTGEENLRMIARLRGFDTGAARRAAATLLERFDLVDARRRRVGDYSGGMRRRLDLAASLLGEPRVVFLDEPTTGLDTRSRQAVWQAIGELTDSGVTVFLTTQYLEEADRLADRIAILDHGRIVAEGTAAELKRQVAAQRLELTMRDTGAFVHARAALAQRALVADHGARTLAVATDGSAARVRALLDEVDPDHHRIEHFAVREATLDDVFLAITGAASNHGPRTDTVDD